MSITLYAPAGLDRIILPSGTYDVTAAGTIFIPEADLNIALSAGFLYSVNVAGVLYKGVIACAGDPNYPGAVVGDQYKVSTAGHIGGVSGPIVQVGDMIECIVAAVTGDHATVGASWIVGQTNVSKPVEAPASTVTASSLVGFDGTTGALIKEITAIPSGTTAASMLIKSVDTDVAAAGVVLSGTTIAADGTDADIDINVTPKGTGSLVTAKIKTPSIVTADNATTQTINIPVSGTDSATHTVKIQIDGNDAVTVVATGDGAGGVGARTISIGVSGAADVIHIGDANALVDLTDAHWSMTEVGVFTFVSMGGNWTNAGRTIADLGIVTTVDINGGTVDALTSLSVRDTSAAYNVTIAATSSVVLDAARALTVDVANASRTIKLAGNLDITGTVTTAAALSFAGAFATTITATAPTTVTLPTNGLLQTAVINGDDALTTSRETNINALATAIALCTELLIDYEAHVIDQGAITGEHKALHVAGQLVSTVAPLTIAEIVTKTNDLQAKYDLHNTDAINAGPTYHIAQETTHALIDTTPITNLQTALTKLNDIKAKYNAHEADSTGHRTGGLHNTAAADVAYGAAISITATGAASGDLVMWGILNDGTGNVTGVSAVAGTNVIVFTFSADPQNDAIISYLTVPVGR
jgi:hypothetical protein